MVVEDARQRTKIFCDTYLLAANMLRADNVTPLQTHVQYAQPEVPTIWLFYGKNNDALFIIDTASSKPLWTQDHQTYAYEETIPISIFTKDTETVQGVKSRWTCEQELRRIVETYFGRTHSGVTSMGALRRFEKSADNEKDMGGWQLYSVKYDLQYKRNNMNYTPTYPSFGYGQSYNCWNYDGDRLSDGVEGDWSTTGTGASQAIEHGDFLALTKDATHDASTVHDTSLNLSADLSKKIRFRYKCSNSYVKAGILVTGSGGTQTVLSATNKANLWTTTVDLNSDLETIETVTLYATATGSHAGAVYYDFVEIYEGDYILPNCTKLSPPQMLNDAVLKIPGMIGNNVQGLGADSAVFSMSCDLDCETTPVTWKRPQTATSKTDKINVQVFEENAHAEAKDVPWHWLNFGYGACKMRLTKITPNYFMDNALDLEFTEYRLSSASVAHENANTRFSLDQVT